MLPDIIRQVLLRQVLYGPDHMDDAALLEHSAVMLLGDVGEHVKHQRVS